MEMPVSKEQSVIKVFTAAFDEGVSTQTGTLFYLDLRKDVSVNVLI